MESRPRLVIQSAVFISFLLAIFGFFVVPAKATRTGGQATGGSTLPSSPAGAHQERLNSACPLNPDFPDSILQWCRLIDQYAQQHQLAPNLVAAVILVESAGQPRAYSKSGAVGLMQVMPRDGIAEKFNCVNGPCFASRPTIKELEDPEFNVAFGTRMLSGLIQKQGSVRAALKAYGPMDVGFSYADKVLEVWDRHR